MKKKNIIMLFAMILILSLTACGANVERVKPKEDVKKEENKDADTSEDKDSPINGYTKEELDKATLPEDTIDESDEKEPTGGLSEEDVEESFQEILDNYDSQSGPIILPEDVLD